MTRTPVSFLVLAGLCAGCSGSEEAAAKHSAAQVTRAVEVLRNAPNPGKATALAGLTKLGCVGADVCDTRDRCAAAYGLHVEGLNLTEAAKLQLANGQELDAAKVLGAAEDKLRDAGPKVVECTDREAALRRRYRL